MKILIIEDDKDVVSLLRFSLKKELYTVDFALNGERGLFLFRTNSYHLIIIDYNLPKKNGRDLIREIKSENQNVKIIVLTIESGQSIKKELFELGIDDYVTKPFIYEELLLRIKAVMRRPSLTEKLIYKIDDLIVDTEKHLAKRGNRNIYLTFKEMLLLEFLLKNKGKIISRTILMENIWDCNADPFSNTIESHILKLRKKLNPDKKRRELIHTIKGRGYKLDLKRW